MPIGNKGVYNMEKNSVAIIIPTLNEENFIAECLESVINQSYPFNLMRIYVIDGGSSDNTKSIVLQYIARYNNIEFLFNDKKIQSSAFNLGVRASNAKFIIRLDAHATYNIDYVAISISHLLENEQIGNVGGICNIKPHKKGLIPKANAILNKSTFGIGGASYRVGTKAMYVDTVPFGAFSRDVIDTVGLMRDDLARGEDNEYNARIRSYGYKIYLDPQIVTTYYARATVATSLKQMYTNGISIGKLLYIDKHSVGLRHIIPLLFVLFLFGGIILSPFCNIISLLFLAILSLYLLLDFVASFSIGVKYGWRFFIIMLILFPSVHIVYGVGTIVGLIKK